MPPKKAAEEYISGAGIKKRADMAHRRGERICQGKMIPGGKCSGRAGIKKLAGIAHRQGAHLLKESLKTINFMAKEKQ